MAFAADKLLQAGYEITPFGFWGAPVLTDTVGRLSCPGFTGDTYAPNDWDFVAIGGLPFNAPDEPKTPGICEVSVRKGRDIDKKKASGGDGARITVHGIEPAMVEIRLTIWTPDQLRWLNDIWAVLFPGLQKTESTETVVTREYLKTTRTETEVVAGKVVTRTFPQMKVITTKKQVKGKPKQATVPFDVDHPVFRQHQIRSLVFIGGDGPSPGAIAKSRVFTMRAVEWIQIQKINTTHSPVEPLGTIYNDAGRPETPGKSGENTAP